MAGRQPGPWRSDQPPPRGNRWATVHGGDSEREIEIEAREVRKAIYEVAPWLDQPEYAPAVARFIRAEGRALLLHHHIATVANEKGPAAVSSRLWEQATAADRLAAQLGNVLGLDPLGKARLQSLAAGTEVAIHSLGKLAEEGREIAERRFAELDAGEES
jgi:hypothetical protein